HHFTQKESINATDYHISLNRDVRLRMSTVSFFLISKIHQHNSEGAYW
ncbi:MAG: hypothetical protein RL063_1928, partial [Pseudomonadota bacterium]